MELRSFYSHGLTEEPLQVLCFEGFVMVNLQTTEIYHSGVFIVLKDEPDLKVESNLPSPKICQPLAIFAPILINKVTTTMILINHQLFYHKSIVSPEMCLHAPYVN